MKHVQRKVRSKTALVIVVLIVTAGCGENQRTHQRSAGGNAELEETTKQIDREYQRLQEQYGRMEMQMPEEMQQLYGQMQQMHGQTMQQHRGMMDRGMMMNGDHMQERGMGLQHEQLWEQHQQMMAMHESMAQMHQGAGRDSIASVHQQMAQLHQQMMGQMPGEEETGVAPETNEETAVDAADLYAQNCASCHGQNLQGLTGAFPPLSGSDWVTGEPAVPIRIILYGLQGTIEVNGQTYNGLMPAFGSRLSNSQVAALVSYLRSAGENDAPAVSAADVQAIRKKYRGRRRPMEADELAE